MTLMAEDAAGRPVEQPDPDLPGPGRRPKPDRAESVETVVFHERGRWVVEIVVMFADSVVRHRIDDFPTKARAEISARLIKRGAERDIEGPLNG